MLELLPGINFSVFVGTKYAQSRIATKGVAKVSKYKYLLANIFLKPLLYAS
jgi:hypothetical protein